jgi:hypothetical protein
MGGKVNRGAVKQEASEVMGSSDKGSTRVGRMVLIGVLALQSL